MSTHDDLERPPTDEPARCRWPGCAKHGPCAECRRGAGVCPFDPALTTDRVLGPQVPYVIFCWN